ncbi:MAG: C4-type zinc ribbon domain-containing protein [Syntrophobacteraceae bacterium]
MLDQLKCLIEYQAVEDKKSGLIRSYEETPKRIAQLEKEFEAFEGEYLSKKAELENSRKMHKALEQSIADLEARITRSRGRMGDVKTNKEYHAILKEIEEIKKEIGGKEDSALELMGGIESLSGELEGIEKEVNERRNRLEEDRAQLEKENAALKERLDRLEAMQQLVKDKLDPDLLKKGEFLLKKQAGIAVAAVQNGVCQVCHMIIPPQKFIELQRDDAILQCPHCHRFIYWPGHEGYCVLEGNLDEI